MKAHRLRKMHCPQCKRLLDGATNAGDSTSRPKSGDISVCIGCATVLTFTKTGIDRASAEDAARPDIRRVVAAIEETMRMRMVPGGEA
jgi:hypothetical protein